MCKKQTSVSHSSTEAEIISLDAGLRMDGIPALSLGFGGWSISFRTEQNWWIEERATVKPVGNCQAKHAQPHPNQEHKRHSNKHWSHPTKYNAFWHQRYVVCLWQRISDQDDYQKSKSHNVACFTDPQSCPGLVVWQDSFGPQDPNLFWHQTSTRRHVDQRKFQTWWVEQSYSCVQYQPFQLHLLHQEFQLDKLLHNGEEDSRSKRIRKSCVQFATSSDEHLFFYCDKFFFRIKSDCI